MTDGFFTPGAMVQPGIREWYEETDFDWYPEFLTLVQSIVKKIESESAE